MDAQDIRNLQEAYLEVYQELDEAKVDDTMNDWQKLKARDKRYLDRLTPRERKYLETDVSGGHKTVAQDRREDHKERRNYRKKLARSTAPSGRSGKYYQDQQRKKESMISPEEIKKRKREDMRRRMSNAAERQGLSDHYDLYDIILSHLLDEGYAETQEAAEAIMVSMSEEWREEILSEMPYQIYGPAPHGPSDSEPVKIGKPYKNKKRARTRADKLDQEIGGYRHSVRFVPEQ